jgi:hypothetical protein
MTQAMAQGRHAREASRRLCGLTPAEGRFYLRASMNPPTAELRQKFAKSFGGGGGSGSAAR